MPTATSSAQLLQDRRAFGRRSTVWHAWIVTSARQRVACCVRNVSDGGALLELKPPEWLPAQFNLHIEGTDIAIACDLRHRGIHGVGVSFSHPAKARVLIELAHVGRSPLHASVPVEAPSVRPKLTPEQILKALQPR